MFSFSSNNRGFSLIELLIVLVIVGTLSAVIIPSYKRYQGRAVQVEAKSNLSLVYQAEKTSYFERGIFEKDLKKISALGQGELRYNIGADWEGESPAFFGYTSSGQCNSCCNGTNSSPCCMKGSEGNSCATNPCFGGAITSIRTKISSISSAISSSSLNLNNKGALIFNFYAIGCTSFSKSNVADLDVWSIDERAFLQNIVDGTD